MNSSAINRALCSTGIRGGGSAIEVGLPTTSSDTNSSRVSVFDLQTIIRSMVVFRDWSVVNLAQTTNSGDIFSFNLPAVSSRHSVPHGKTRRAEIDLAALLKMRGATQVHNEYARPSDRANVSHVRLPVRQQNLDFREGCGVGRPPIRLERMDVAPVTALDRMPDRAGAPRDRTPRRDRACRTSRDDARLAPDSRHARMSEKCQQRKCAATPGQPLTHKSTGTNWPDLLTRR
jgi:hypothetical protein